MAKYSAAFCCLPLLLVLLLSGQSKGESCEPIIIVGGGCPDINQCAEKCKPCYRGFGKVTPYCSGPKPNWACECHFEQGAPCPPFSDPPTCPAR